MIPHARLYLFLGVMGGILLAALGGGWWCGDRLGAFTLREVESWGRFVSSGMLDVVTGRDEFVERESAEAYASVSYGSEEEEDGPSTNGSALPINYALPRTSQVLYNVLSPHEKYLTYSPSGGWSNQLIELATALMLARATNRCLIVPEAAEHTSGWATYDRLHQRQLYPMDRLLDFPAMERFFARTWEDPVVSPEELRTITDKMRPRLVPLDLPLLAWRGFVAAARKRNQTSNHPHRVRVKELPNNLDRERFKQWVKTDSHDHVLYLHGKGFYGSGWFPVHQYVKTKAFIRPAPYIRELALRLVHATFLGPRKFNAIHVRLGDYAKMGRSPDANWWVHTIRSAGFSRDVPLYIATDLFSRKARASFFAPLKQAGYSLTFKDGLLPRRVFLEYANSFSREARNDFCGLLEQLVCVQAAKFRATYFSTFSAYIDFMRRHVAGSFPELVPFLPINSTSTNATTRAEEDDLRDEEAAILSLGDQQPGGGSER